MIVTSAIPVLLLYLPLLLLLLSSLLVLLTLLQPRTLCLPLLISMFNHGIVACAILTVIIRSILLSLSANMSISITSITAVVFAIGISNNVTKLVVAQCYGLCCLVFLVQAI